MEQLPHEALLFIANSLDKRSQIQWSFVNRFWCNWLRRECLFDKVNLYDPSRPPWMDNMMGTMAVMGGPMMMFDTPDEYVSEFNEELDFFDRTNYGKKTKHLTIHSSNVGIDSLWDMVDLFPRIECLSWSLPPSNVDDEVVRAILCWKYIKKVERDPFGTINRILFESPFHTAQLEELSLVCAPGRDRAEDGRFYTNTFLDINDLVYIENLQSLTLRDAYINFDAIHDIHQMAPVFKFKSLNLLNIHDAANEIEHRAGAIECTVDRGARLDHLSIMMAPDSAFLPSAFLPGQKCVVGVMKLISDVYTDLISFEIAGAAWEFKNPRNYEDPTFCTYLCRGLSKWRNLKKYSCEYYPLTNGVLQCMSSNNVKLRDLTVYKDIENALWCNQYTNLLSHSNVLSNLRRLHFWGFDYNSVDNRQGYHELLRVLPQLEVISFETNDAYNENYPTSLVVDTLNRTSHLKEFHLKSLMGQCPEYNAIMTVNQPSKLTILKIDFDNVSLTAASARMLNATLDSIISHSPLLEEFQARVHTETDISRNVEVIFNFERALKIRKIAILIQSSAYFKTIVQGRTSICYKEDVGGVVDVIPKDAVESNTRHVCLTIIANEFPKIITDVDLTW